MWIQDALIIKVNGLEQSATEALNNRTRNLVLQSFRIHDRATVESLDDTNNADLPIFNKNFGAGCDASVLLDSTPEAKPVCGRAFLLAPSEFLGCSLKHSA